MLDSHTFVINFTFGNIVSLLVVKGGGGVREQLCSEGHVMSLHDLDTW